MRVRFIIPVVIAIISMVSCGNDGNRTEKKNKLENITADEYFQSTDFSRYIGSHVGDLLDDIPFQYNNMSGFDEPPGKLAGVSYEFESGYEIRITAKSLWHTKRFDKNRQWDLSDFSEEAIGGIEIRRYAPNPYKKVFGIN